MELKYTIEIITKDIQEIENLVGKLKNSGDASMIEMDLALSKLQRVYEVLSMIRQDQLTERSAELEKPAAPVVNKTVEPKPEPLPPSKPEVKPEPEIKPAPTPAEPSPVPEAEFIPEPKAVTKPGHLVEPKPEPVAKASPETEAKVEKDGHILAESFSSEASLNEEMPIDSIARNIGINDRFLIIRELFDGDADGFAELLSQLDKAGTYQDASQLMSGRFAREEDHEGLEILKGLLKRRYSKQNG